MKKHPREFYELAKKELDYDPITGIVRWAVHKRKFLPGSVAGSIDKITGYRDIGFYGKHLLAHRFAWFVVHGEVPDDQIDHIDGNRENNAISNLRLASQSQNSQNTTLSKSNTSGIKGVSWYKRIGKWDVRIRANGKQKHLGYYDTLEEAKSVIEKHREALHKEYANHG